MGLQSVLASQLHVPAEGAPPESEGPQLLTTRRALDEALQHLDDHDWEHASGRQQSMHHGKDVIAIDVVLLLNMLR